MKSFGSGIILKSGAVEPMDCLHYSLNIPFVRSDHRDRQEGGAGSGIRCSEIVCAYE